METNERSLFENLSLFLRKSVTLKLIVIFILMLLLMIPVSFIMSLIREREALSQSAEEEVSNKWAKEQIIYGPVLTMPVIREFIEEGKAKSIREEIHFLPSLLKVNGQIAPLILNRGIYKVVVYTSDLTISGSFTDIKEYLGETEIQEILWDEAFLTVHVSDLRGINERVLVNWNKMELKVEPGTGIPEIVQSGFTVNEIFSVVPDSDEYFFEFDLNLQGSRHLGFAPIGKETTVNLTSEWQHPRFSGYFLPDNRSVNDEGFEAEYKVIELNRNYPQMWEGNKYAQSIHESSFGVDLLLPVNEYQKAMRSAKYALLVIAITFLAFFLVEVFNRKSVHPFQYILIGLALVLFYTLLVSISEHTSFEFAYMVAVTSVIAMTGLYSRAILNEMKHIVILVGILLLSYTLIYFMLQAQDYALLMGSILLAIILALTMFITRKINWYELGSTKTD